MVLTTRTRTWCVGLRAVLESNIPGSLPFQPGLPSYLAVQAQEDEHHEEQGGPQWGEGNHGDGLGVSDKGQAGAWRGRREKGAEWSSMPHSIVILIQHVLSASFVPGAVPNSHSNHVNLPATPCYSYYYDAHCTDEQAEAERGKQGSGRVRFKPRLV